MRTTLEAAVEVQEDYDPMIYDVMREAATRLIGEYVARENAADRPVDAFVWRQKWLALAAEVNAVPEGSREAVELFTRELRVRRQQLSA